jgi:sortase A
VTLVAEPPASVPSSETRSANFGAAPVSPTVAGGAPAPSSAGRLRVLLLAWVGALVAALALVVFGFGPVFQDRVQRSLLREYRTEVDNVSNGAGTGPLGANAAPRAPELGSTVGILEVGDVRIQQAVVEGVRSSDTRKGPGHVPGTAGLGQPGNSVVVGRRSGFGGPFGGIGGLHKGNEIAVTTTQGQSVYSVTSVKHVSLHNPPPEGSAGTPSAEGAKVKDDRAGLIDTVYGPSSGDQLTLITSDSHLPWNSAKATVVVAELEDLPFPPTLQGGRHEGDTGGHPDGDAKAAAILAMLVYGLAMGAAVLLYRRLPHRVAYLLTVAPIVALTIVAGETFSRLFPAWM